MTKTHRRLLGWIDAYTALEARRKELSESIAQGHAALRGRKTLIQSMPDEALTTMLADSGNHPTIWQNAYVNKRYYTHQKLVNMVLLLNPDAVVLATKEREFQRVERRLAQLDAQVYPPGMPREQRAREIAEALRHREQQQETLQATEYAVTH